MVSAAQPLIISKFDKDMHDRSQFSCSFKPIDNFLKKSLSEQVKSRVLTAYLETEYGSKTVLAFYALSALSIRADLGPKTWTRARIPDIPAIYVRAVAVDETEQGRGLGTALVVDALKRSSLIADKVGAAAVFLDVLMDTNFERRWTFYKKLGCQPLNDPDNPTRMFKTLADIRITLE